MISLKYVLVSLFLLTLSLQTIAQKTADSEVIKDDSLSIHPNPSLGKFHISTDNETIDYIELTNKEGKHEYFYSNDINTNLSGKLTLEVLTKNGKHLVEYIKVINLSEN